MGIQAGTQEIHVSPAHPRWPSSTTEAACFASVNAVRQLHRGRCNGQGFQSAKFPDDEQGTAAQECSVDREGPAVRQLDMDAQVPEGGQGEAPWAEILARFRAAVKS